MYIFINILVSVFIWGELKPKPRRYYNGTRKSPVLRGFIVNSLKSMNINYKIKRMKKFPILQVQNILTCIFIKLDL